LQSNNPQLNGKVVVGKTESGPFWGFWGVIPKNKNFSYPASTKALLPKMQNIIFPALTSPFDVPPQKKVDWANEYMFISLTPEKLKDETLDDLSYKKDNDQLSNVEIKQKQLRKITNVLKDNTPN